MSSTVQIPSTTEIKPVEPKLLNVPLVSPHSDAVSELQIALNSIDIVGALGHTSSVYSVADGLLDNPYDVVVFDNAIPWEQIIATVREIRLHETLHTPGNSAADSTASWDPAAHAPNCPPIAGVVPCRGILPLP